MHAWLQGVAGSQWRPVCFTVQADSKADAAGIKQWLQTKQSLKSIDLSEQGFLSAAGPVGQFVAAAKEVLFNIASLLDTLCSNTHQSLHLQAATKAGAEVSLSSADKVAAVQQLFQADKVEALTAEREARVKRDADATAAFKV